MFEPSILTLCCIGAMLWLIASPLERGTPVPAKLVVLHLAGDTDAGYFTNFVSCCTIRVHSGLLRPLMAHLTENFEAPSNFSQSQQAALDVANVLGEAAAALADSEMLPASRPRRTSRIAPPPSFRSRQERAMDRTASQRSDGQPGTELLFGHEPGPAAEPSHEPLEPRGSGWSKQQRRKDWDNWGQETDWHQSQEVKELRQQVETLQEHVRLLARMSLRQEDELSQAPNRARLLAYLPLNVETDPASTNMLLLEKKEKGEVDSSLRLVLFLGLVRQCIKQITTRMEQPEGPRATGDAQNSFARRMGERRWSGHILRPRPSTTRSS